MASLALALIFAVCCQSCASSLDYDTSIERGDPDDQSSGNVCKDCTQIIQLLADILSNADFQKKIMNGLESVCDHLPGPAPPTQACKEQVEKMFPMAIKFLLGFVKPEQICKVMGLCSSGEKQKLLRNLAEAIEAAGDESSPQCSFCIFFVKTLEDLLPKERTEDAVIKLLQDICKIMPSVYRDQCHSVIDKYSKLLMDAILSYATPQALCALIHMCKGMDAPEVDLCAMSAYRCKDMQTALKCGTFHYCQTFSWKPLNTM